MGPVAADRPLLVLHSGTTPGPQAQQYLRISRQPLMAVKRRSGWREHAEESRVVVTEKWPSFPAYFQFANEMFKVRLKIPVV